MNYFDSDMSNSTNTVVYLDWKTAIYIYVCGQCRTQFMLPNSETIIHQHVLLRRESVHILLQRKVSRIVTKILCLHVLIARHILLILDMLIIFSEYRCLKC
jgi:hypothetical protein